MVLPLLWRSLLQNYLRTLTLSVATFLAVLVVTRFKEIARFTALSGDWGKTLLFIAYQFPLILPMAIPISALIASHLLFQRLSRTHELTALRASGLSLRSILAPLLFASILLSIGNFSICAELSPYCRRESKTMLFQETSANPLLLLQRQHLGKLKHAYLDMHLENEGKEARDVTLITYNESQKRLILLQAEKLTLDDDELIGKNSYILSHPNGSEEGYDPLVIENQASLSTAAPILSQFLKKSLPKLQAEAKPLRMLLLQEKLEKKRAAGSARIEILRRATLSLAVFSFTLLGAAFGISTRRIARQNTLWMLLLALTVMASYLMGKGLKTQALYAFAIFLLPHPFIWSASLFWLKKIAKGSA